MAIVWPCQLSVDAYVALGKKLEIPRPNCPDCSAAMVFWSGYLRPVRVLGRCVRLFVRRARCKVCAVTHALLPAFVLHKRLDAAETIGAAISAVVDGESGLRPIAARLAVPHTTARGWLRRFGARAEELALSFAALAVELGGALRSRPEVGSTAALRAVRDAFEAASVLPGWAGAGLWGFCSAVGGGRLLSANTSSPYLIVGRRRFMPPVPFPTRAKERTGGS